MYFFSHRVSEIKKNECSFFKDINIGRQTWEVTTTPEIRISHPLSAPVLSWCGKWRLRCQSDAQNVDLELNYDNNKINGTLNCGNEQQVQFKFIFSQNLSFQNSKIP